MHWVGQLWWKAIIGIAVATVVSACVVDTPSINTTQAPVAPTAIVQPTVAPRFEPTLPAISPTSAPLTTPTSGATPAPTAEATALPGPTTVPVPAGPPPLPTSAPEAEFQPVTVGPGLVAIPVQGARFRLTEAHPVLQLGGHTLIYVDDERNAEVDIFTPMAEADGTAIGSYGDLITYLSSDAVFANLLELDAVSIAGFPTRVFEGTAESPDRAFITEIAAASNDQLGWFPPARMRLWVIDHPSGAVIISAESLENPGRYSDAVRLATEVLSTIEFG